MKKFFFLSLMIISTIVLPAQKGPLNGSGKIISKIADYKDFDKISLTDLSGKMEVEVGKPFSINIEIDDNLESLLAVSVKNGKLEMELKGNQQNKLYIENTNINIKISLPVISILEHRGNNNVVVNGITGSYFLLKKSGNGEVELNGMIDELEIKKSGNGDIQAMRLMTEIANIQSSGNGDITVNVAKEFKANGSGNGNIKNTGVALVSAASTKSGNGDIVDASCKPKMNAYTGYENDVKVKTRIQNNTNKTVELKVVYPIKGSYEIDIKAGSTQSEYFPLGTKIYLQGKMKEPLFEITPENRETVLVIE